MSGNPNPNLNNISRPKPDWSCKQWSFPEHDWLSCPSCQNVYQAHLEAEKRGEPGVLHWFREDIREATACGSRSDATTPFINGSNLGQDQSINGKLYIDPKVTCPLCRDMARNEGVLREIPNHTTPAPEAHFD